MDVNEAKSKKGALLEHPLFFYNFFINAVGYFFIDVNAA